MAKPTVTKLFFGSLIAIFPTGLIAERRSERV